MARSLLHGGTDDMEYMGRPLATSASHRAITTACVHRMPPHFLVKYGA